MGYTYDPRLGGGTGRYRNEAGRIISNGAARVALDQTLANAADPMVALFDQLSNGLISLADFQSAGMTAIKNTHLSAIALERGGWENMTQADYGRAGQRIREQYGYWNQLTADIGSGKQKINGRLKQRMNSYVQAGRETYNRSKASYAASHGLNYVGSELTPADHCVDCVAMDGRWFEVGDSEYIQIGERICHKNCKCLERYGRMVDGGIVESSDGDSVESLSFV